MKYLLISIVISILVLPGCFSNPKESNGGFISDLNLLWQYEYEPDGGAPRVKPLIHYNMVITSGDVNTIAIDFKTGNVVWKTPLNHHRQLLNSTFGLNGDILTGSVARKVIAWNIFSGEELWKITFDDSLSFNNSRGIGVIPNGFIAVSNGPMFYRINFNGIMESVLTDARSYEMYYNNGVLYTGQVKNMEGMVSAYDVNTFELLWRFNPGGLAYPAYTAPIVENYIVYIGTTAGPTGSRNGFFALNAQTGEEIWRREGIFTYSAVLAGDRIFGVNGQRVWALDKHTGELLWITQGRGGHSESNLDYLDGHVYWAHGGGLHVFNAESGELLHVMPAPHGSFFWLVTADKGRIFAQSSSHLYAFAPWGHKEPVD